MNPLTVRTVLRDVLQACEDAYLLPNAPALPVRRWISHGQPMWLGEQLCVWSGGLSATRPFPLPRLTAPRSTVVPGTTVMIEVVRECWPQASVTSANKATPDPSSYTSGAEAVALDAATLFAHIAQLTATGVLLPTVGTVASDIALQPMVAVGPTGPHVGYRWPILVKLATVT
jgi:hypothetical protein